MSYPTTNYFQATRHPYACLLFLLPLLAIYEGGVIYVGGDNPAFRTGADTWMRWAFQTFGLPALHWPPILITGLFAFWTWLHWETRPQDLPGVLLGMTVESVGYALILWALGRIHEPILEGLGIALAQAVPLQTLLQSSAAPDRVSQAISFLGAGIYEEMLFRLFLYSGLFYVIQHSVPSRLTSGVVAGVLSALAFSAAHHLGPSGEPLDQRVFLFRTLAGLFFVLLYQLRGFGIAVGAHACYDVMVGAAAG
ncbi:MAG: CPBP family intramembrane metalloprotease [Gemmatales bacterium]|nr:CPBP family intramembrane metalloprotease [Gemmatales bacterium]MDW8385411.1 CPBP family intramembrane glutamic endopeptidase [Gemmatales bacterium]